LLRNDEEAEIRQLVVDNFLVPYRIGSCVEVLSVYEGHMLPPDDLAET